MVTSASVSGSSMLRRDIGNQWCVKASGMVGGHPTEGGVGKEGGHRATGASREGRRISEEVEPGLRADSTLSRGQICGIMEPAAFGGSELTSSGGVQAEAGRSVVHIEKESPPHSLSAWSCLGKWSVTAQTFQQKRMWLNGRAVQLYCPGTLDSNPCMTAEQDSWSCDAQAGAPRNQGWSWVLRAKWGVPCRLSTVAPVTPWLSCCSCHPPLHINALPCPAHTHIHACIHTSVMVTPPSSPLTLMLCSHTLGATLSRVTIFYSPLVSQLTLRLCPMGFPSSCFCGCFPGQSVPLRGLGSSQGCLGKHLRRNWHFHL